MEQAGINLACFFVCIDDTCHVSLYVSYHDRYHDTVIVIVYVYIYVYIFFFFNNR